MSRIAYAKTVVICDEDGMEICLLEHDCDEIYLIKPVWKICLYPNLK